MHLGIASSLLAVLPSRRSYKPRLGTSLCSERGQLGVQQQLPPTLAYWTGNSLSELEKQPDGGNKKSEWCIDIGILFNTALPVGLWGVASWDFLPLCPSNSSSCLSHYSLQWALASNHDAEVPIPLFLSSPVNIELSRLGNNWVDFEELPCQCEHPKLHLATSVSSQI